MSDLVELLRDIANDQTYCNGRMCAAESWMEDAADRIEELEAAALKWADSSLQKTDRIEELEAEVERLRAALTDIRDSTYRSAVMLRARADRALAAVKEASDD